jgi:REP element-mobilizing transposase RayT
MPNHTHGILILDQSQLSDDSTSLLQTESKKFQESLTSLSPQANSKTPGEARYQNQGKNSVSSMIGSFKSVCTKNIHIDFPQKKFGWQELFWDNIIMNQQAFEQISHYIAHNPANWQKDKFYPS